MQDEVKITQADELLEQISDEADLCRNDGANDIAELLDKVREWIAAHQAEQRGGEVVAWMYEREGFNSFATLWRNPPSDGWTETPLYAHPTPKADAMREALVAILQASRTPAIIAIARQALGETA